MNLTKKILALLLAFAMAMALALPAFAEPEAEPEVIAQDEINWDDFYIVSKTPNTKIEYGESYTLSVEVSIPEGTQVTYEWYEEYAGDTWKSGGPVREFTPGASDYPWRPPFRTSRPCYYQCKITVREIGAEEQTSENAHSLTAFYYITITNYTDDRSVWGRVWDFLAAIPQGFFDRLPFFSNAALSIVVWLLLLPISIPLLFVIMGPFGLLFAVAPIIDTLAYTAHFMIDYLQFLMRMFLEIFGIYFFNWY